MDASQLYVVTPYSNFLRYKSREKHYWRFHDHMKKSGVKLITVELALGDRPFEVTQGNDLEDLQLRTWDEMWHKEMMINLGVWYRLPKDWQYLAWIDCDLEFINPDWAKETVYQLQHFQWVQLFQTANDLGPNMEVMQTHNGFVWSYLQGLPYKKGKQYTYWHPGYAWACRREAFDGVGGLFHQAICGSGDHHMALSLIGHGKDSVPADLSPSYMEQVLAWEKRALDVVRMDIGYVPGTISHFFHGKKVDRRYWQRWDVLRHSNFNPNIDIVRDGNGLYKFSNLNPKFRDGMRRYFRQRNEDSIDLV